MTRCCILDSRHRHCASCGASVFAMDGDALCSHHGSGTAEWALTNRVICDLLHREIQPAPVVMVLDELVTTGWEHR